MFRRCEDGLTLLELVIALAIMSMLLIPVLNMFAGATFSIFRGGQETRAVMMAQERMEEFKYMGYSFVDGKVMEGQARVLLNDTADSFSREVILEKMEIVTDANLSGGSRGIFYIRPAGEDTTCLANVIFIKVIIGWMEGEKERSVSLSSYLSPR